MRIVQVQSGTRRQSIEAWSLVAVVSLLIGIAGCSDDGRATAPPFIESGDLQQIREQGTLRVLLPMMDRNAYLPRGDGPLESERDLVEAFARQEQPELEMLRDLLHSEDAGSLRSS